MTEVVSLTNLEERVQEVNIADLSSDPNDDEYLIADGRIKLNPDTQQVQQDGVSLPLTPLEIKVLSVLAGQADTAVKTENLTTYVWGTSDKNTFESARVTVSDIRKKLSPDLGDIEHGAIRTRRGVGYYALSNTDSDPYRTSAAEWNYDEDNIHVFGGGRVEVNADARQVKADGETKQLTPYQFKFVSLLASRPNKVLGYAQIASDVWGSDLITIQASMRVLVNSTRRLLGPELGDAKKGAIRNKPAVGYYALGKALEEA